MPAPRATLLRPRVLLCVASIAMVGCGRSGFIELPVAPTLTADVARIVNASDTAMFTGDCAEGLPVRSAAAAETPCVSGRFFFETPPATTDGVRVYVLSQTNGDAIAEISVTWVRNATPPQISLDQPTIINALDSAVFRGACTSISGNVGVLPGGQQVPCANDRFAFTTPSATTDATRVYTFTQSNAAAVNREVVGTWIRNLALPRLTLDTELVANGDDTAVFSGDCSPIAGSVTVDEAGVIGSVPCNAGSRFVYETPVRTADAVRTYVFSQQATTGEIVSVIGRWAREAVPALVSTAGVQAVSTFGDAVAIDEDVILVGAPSDDGAGTNAGAVFVYRRGDGGWGDPSVLRPTAPRAFEAFGEDIAFVNGIAVVGANGDATNGVQGRVYAFAYNAGTWQQLTFFQENVLSYGNRVSFDGTRLAVRSREDVGAAVHGGAVYLYDYAPPNWISRGRLASPTPVTEGAFGFRVEIAGDWLLVLAFQPDAPWLFQRAPAGWAPHNASADFPSQVPALPVALEFYNATAMTADRFVVVYPPSEGAAIFRLTGGVWRREDSFPGLASTLGSAVALRGDDLILVQDTTPTTVLHYRFGADGWTERGRHVLAGSAGDLSDCIIGANLVVACTNETAQVHYAWRLPAGP